MDVSDAESHSDIVKNIFQQFSTLDYVYLNAARAHYDNFEV